MLDNLQVHINMMSQELNTVIQSVTLPKEQVSITGPLESAVQQLFKIRQIPYPESYDKATCESTIKTFAELNNWRPATFKKTINQLDSVFSKQIKPEERLSRRQLKKLEKNKISAQELHEDNLRTKLLKFGVRIGNDFRKDVLLQLVHQKATELKWRKDTLAKNLVIINKILDRNPLVKSASTWNWFADMDASRNKGPIVQPIEKNDKNDSDSDASFIEYMSSALERMDANKTACNLFIEQSDAFVDNGLE